MKFNLDIKNFGPDSWAELNKSGFRIHAKRDGLIYKYVNFETATKIVSNSNLQYSSFLNFNDPFDLTPDLISTDLTIAEATTILTNQMAGDKEEIAALIDFNSKRNDFFSTITHQAIRELMSDIGITCFSKSFHKTLMWSHYADKHNGICLGFSFEEPGEKGFMQLDIKYADSIIPVNFFHDPLHSIYNWIFTKSSIWNYEEEVRRVHISKTGLLPFQKHELKEIYFGLKVSDENLELFRKLLHEKGYKVEKESKMIMNKSTFDLKEEFLSKYNAI